MHIHAVTSSQNQNFSANWGQILNQQFNQLERKVSRLGGAEERRIFGKAKQIISSINGNIDCKNTTKNGMNFRTYFLQKPRCRRWTYLVCVRASVLSHRGSGIRRWNTDLSRVVCRGRKACRTVY